jgi:hypothetical protein
MGAGKSTLTDQLVSFKTLQEMTPNMVLIHTFKPEEQHCLIRGSLTAAKEMAMVQELMSDSTTRDVMMVVYGRNYMDPKPYQQADHLRQLGFRRVYVYAGGLFEWLMLHDLYGAEAFPLVKTDSTKDEDPLKYA